MRLDRREHRSDLCVAEIGASGVAQRGRAMGRQNVAAAGILAGPRRRAKWPRSRRRLCAHRLFSSAPRHGAARSGAWRRAGAFHRGAGASAAKRGVKGRPMPRPCRTFAFVYAVLVSAVTGAAQSEAPQLQLHQNYMEEVMRPTTLDVADPMKVFAFVFNSLPDRVKVYPTENYFYFKFTHNGVEYAGNIRLDASDRDKGKVQFAYYEQMSGWLADTPGFFKALDASDGIKLEKLERFVYRMSYGGKSVVFELNELSQVRPPANALTPDETFIGPIFDDSSVRFFLVYNSAINNFLYILDETVNVTDDFFSNPKRDHILVGKRTGFVFYRDRRRHRKILIGAYSENVEVNNYLDGPFDQLPDNFIEGETLRNAILKVQPNLRG